ncbi:MAG: glycoside hydrolase family 16 protein [Bacteroidetes bacterium]|nr:glycoside hydrolase family 16 protein [Bacteroidota bacterium]
MIALYPIVFLPFWILNSNAYVKTEKKWDLIWSDEFNYRGLPDSVRWSYETGYVRNEELQYYTENCKKNARVEKGNLILEAHKEGSGLFGYTSSSLHTRGKFEFTYGKAEIRAKLPGCRGTLAAFWMLPAKLAYGEYLKSGEIDLMECVGYDPLKIHCTVHTQAYNEFAGTKQGGTEGMVGVTPQRKFHVYSMEWYPDKLLFFTENKLIFQFNKLGNSSDVWPFDKPFYLIMSLAVGGTWASQQGIANDGFPQKMTIDYVRVYKLRE